MGIVSLTNFKITQFNREAKFALFIEQEIIGFHDMNKMCLWNTNAPDNSQKMAKVTRTFKYLDTSRKMSSQEVFMCIMKL